MHGYVIDLYCRLVQFGTFRQSVDCHPISLLSQLASVPYPFPTARLKVTPSARSNCETPGLWLGTVPSLTHAVFVFVYYLRLSATSIKLNAFLKISEEGLTICAASQLLLSLREGDGNLRRHPRQREEGQTYCYKATEATSTGRPLVCAPTN